MKKSIKLKNKTVMDISVFKTNVHLASQATMVTERLEQLYNPEIINFDLEDCDRILRMKIDSSQEGEVETTLNQLGFKCSAL